MLNKILKSFIFVIFGVFIFSTSIAQTKVIGYVGTQGSSIPSVAVLFRKPIDSTLIHAALTNSYGRFHLDSIAMGNYLVEIRAIGFKPLFRDVLIDKKQKATYLKGFRLELDTLQLKGVEISANQNGIKVFAGKTVFTPDSLSIKNSKSALDVISKIPEITVKKSSGIIKVMGNSNILVLINGADNNRSLKSINPDNIERIELIVHPSAKYRSNVASVINVILKDNRKQGLYINASATISVNRRDHFANAQLTYTLRKMQFFVNYGGHTSSSESRDSTYLSILDNDNNNEQFSLSKSKLNSLSQRIQYGVDIFPSKNDIVCLTGNFRSYNRENLLINESNNMFNSVFESTNNNLTNSEYKKSLQNYSIYYKHNTKKKNHFVWNTNFYIMNSSNYSLVNDTSVYLTISEPIISERHTESISTRYSINSKMYFTKKWNKKYTTDIGYQLYGSKINSQSESQGVNDYVDYINLQNSVFTNINYNSGKKFSGQFGLRIDNLNNTLYDSIKNNFFTFMPSFSVLYKLNSKNSIRINYNKKLRFPNYYELNPFERYSIDSITNSSGNPNLNPETSHLINAKYTYQTKGLYLFSELEYKYTDNIIVQEIQSGSNTIQSKYMNLGKANSYGIDFGFYTQLFKFIELNGQVMLNYHIFPNRSSYNGWGYRAEVEAVVPLPLGMYLEAYFAYSEKEILYNGMCFNKYFIPEILLTMDVLDNGTIGIGVNNPFISTTGEQKEWTTTTINTSNYTDLNSLTYVVYFSYYFNAGRKRRKMNSTKKEIQLQMDKDNK